MAVSSAATLCFLALCVALVVGQQQPLPKRFPGFERGNPAAPIFLQEFADYQCPDCAEANPTVEKVLAYYGPDKIHYVLHVYPLWLHRQAWDASLASFIVAKHVPSRFWDYSRYAFANQAAIYNSAFYNKTEADLYGVLADWAGRFGVPRPIFYSEMANPDIIAMADANKHYGILNQVYGTPTFVINGFKAESLTQTSTLQDWQAVLNPLLS